MVGYASLAQIRAVSPKSAEITVPPVRKNHCKACNKCINVLARLISGVAGSPVGGGGGGGGGGGYTQTLLCSRAVGCSMMDEE